jgi:hypothetical protein
MNHSAQGNAFVARQVMDPPALPVQHGKDADRDERAGLVIVGDEGNGKLEAGLFLKQAIPGGRKPAIWSTWKNQIYCTG